MGGGRALAQRVAQLFRHTLGMHNVVLAIIGHAFAAVAGSLWRSFVRCRTLLSLHQLSLCTADDGPFAGASDGGTCLDDRTSLAARAHSRLLCAAMCGVGTAPQQGSGVIICISSARSGRMANLGQHAFQCARSWRCASVATKAHGLAHIERPIDLERYTLYASQCAFLYVSL